MDPTTGNDESILDERWDMSLAHVDVRDLLAELREQADDAIAYADDALDQARALRKSLDETDRPSPFDADDLRYILADLASFTKPHKAAITASEDLTFTIQDAEETRQKVLRLLAVLNPETNS